MFVVQQLGESANTLVARHKGYRYGFPDFYAAEFPFAPMNYDQSRIYQGAIGRQYPDARTERYHYLYDPNMYLQPGVPTGAGLGSGTLVSPAASTDQLPNPGRYIAMIRRVPSCATAPQGAQIGRDCVRAEDLRPNTDAAFMVNWEGLIESPFVWGAVGVTVAVAGIVGGLIGSAIGKRRAARGR
jgi:hypothetical protein